MKQNQLMLMLAGCAISFLTIPYLLKALGLEGEEEDGATKQQVDKEMREKIQVS